MPEPQPQQINKILSYSFGFAKDKKKKAALLLIYTAAKGEKDE